MYLSSINLGYTIWSSGLGLLNTSETGVMSGVAVVDCFGGSNLASRIGIGW
jgi:hypothetical protein